MAELHSTTAEAIANTLKDCLLRFNLPLADCRGQCYDGASVMAGCKSGVAAIILKASNYLHLMSHTSLAYSMLFLLFEVH